MLSRQLHVYIDLNNSPTFVGRLWSYFRNGRETASFEYDASWLSHPLRFSLEPALDLYAGKHHTEKSLFGSLGDSAPDRWGRILMRRFEANRAREAQNRPHPLNEVDYLILVEDALRQGALRFKEPDRGGVLSTSPRPVPLFVDLLELQSAAHHVLSNTEKSEELQLLLAPGASLGGARPKACVQDQEGNLFIAKFPRKDDDVSVVLWEAVALTLAKAAGIRVPEWFLLNGALLIKRFDREGRKRIPFLSAMSLLGADDHDVGRSYLEIVEAIAMYGAQPHRDLKELWTRIIFSILISNLDDHLRNHAFLYEIGKGWALSPLYDVNPTPYAGPLTLNISETENTASLELALSVANRFRVRRTEAEALIGSVTEVVRGWKEVATQLGVPPREMKIMTLAFRI